MAGWDGPLGRGLVIAALAAVFMAWAGAFGSDAAPPVARFLYWLAMLVGGTFLALGVTEAVERMGLLADRPWAQTALITVVMAVPYTFVVWAVSGAVFPAHGHPSPLHNFGPVLMVSAVMTAINRLASRRPVETHAGPADAPPPRFLDRLPPKL